VLILPLSGHLLDEVLVQEADLFLLGVVSGDGACLALLPSAVHVATLVQRLLVIASHQLNELYKLLKLFLLLPGNLTRANIFIELTLEVDFGSVPVALIV